MSREDEEKKLAKAHIWPAHLSAEGFHRQIAEAMVDAIDARIREALKPIEERLARALRVTSMHEKIGPADGFAHPSTYRIEPYPEHEPSADQILSALQNAEPRTEPMSDELREQGKRGLQDIADGRIVRSRSVQRREAIQRGEAAPDVAPSEAARTEAPGRLPGDDFASMSQCKCDMCANNAYSFLCNSHREKLMPRSDYDEAVAALRSILYHQEFDDAIALLAKLDATKETATDR